MILSLLHQAIAIQEEKAKAISFFNPIDPEYTNKEARRLEAEYNMVLDKLTIALNERGVNS